ncbi:hypothetical protein ACOCJ4_05565 [Knoellia sp. CPCC 206435]|uniref:hypothetical protein n=1 Tax=Knoellia terrae TaxID=3404797 RepID=UPI003B43C244
MDPILIAVEVLRTLRLTGPQAEAAAHLVAQTEPSLREVLDSLPAAEVAVIRKRYPQGLKRLLDGDPLEDGLAAIPGLGDRKFSDLTTATVQPLMALCQRRVAARMAASPSGPQPGAGPRSGYAAARQVRFAARAVASLLLRHDYLAKDPLTGLPTPQAPGPVRDRAFRVTERRDFCRTVMLNASDPELAAASWIIVSVYGAREVEVERLTEVSVNLDRGSIVLVGKDGPVRERPIHREFGQWLLDTMAARPPAQGGQLLRTIRGTPVNGHLWDNWSSLLHRFHPWVHGVRIGVHGLRHSTTRMVKAMGYEDAEAGRWLGHAAPSAARVDSIYTRDNSAAGEWAQCVDMAHDVFGPLDGWPALPENDILGAALGLDLPCPPKTSHPKPRRPRQPAGKKKGKKHHGKNSRTGP